MSSKVTGAYVTGRVAGADGVLRQLGAVASLAMQLKVIVPLG